MPVEQQPIQNETDGDAKRRRPLFIKTFLTFIRRLNQS
jgi:hypothetical protein